MHTATSSHIVGPLLTAMVNDDNHAISYVMCHVLNMMFHTYGYFMTCLPWLS